MASPTPTRTASSRRGASASVATSVARAMTPCHTDSRQKRARALTSTSEVTAAMTSPANAARGSVASTPANGSSASTARPVIPPLERLVAPAILFRAVREKEPPTGKPALSPDARLATPWEISSRSGSQGRRSAPA